jgi:NAD(P)-dependent dehydrogenase (short-subunit alcohol dehydrogenase family)
MNAQHSSGAIGGAARRLEGRVALITGGTGGIGAATVRRFVAEGAWVVASGRSSERGSEIVRELGDHVRFIAADVTRPEQIDSLIDETVAWRGRLDVLFNNAGETQAPASLLALEPATLHVEIDTLLTSVVLATRKAALAMREHGGVILNCSSTAAHRAGSQSAVYSALKAAVSHFTRCAALELAEQKIRVNAISPGAIVTPMFLKALAVPAGRESEALDLLREVFGKALPAGRGGGGLPCQRRRQLCHRPGLGRRRRAHRGTVGRAATPAGNDDRRSSQVEARDLTEPDRGHHRLLRPRLALQPGQDCVHPG